MQREHVEADEVARSIAQPMMGQCSRADSMSGRSARPPTGNYLAWWSMNVRGMSHGPIDRDQWRLENETLELRDILPNAEVLEESPRIVGPARHLGAPAGMGEVGFDATSRSSATSYVDRTVALIAGHVFIGQALANAPPQGFRGQHAVHGLVSGRSPEIAPAQHAGEANISEGCRSSMCEARWHLADRRNHPYP